MIRNARKLGSYYQLFVAGKDLTEFVVGEVRLEQQSDYIQALTFNLMDGINSTQFVKPLHKVKLYAGSMDSNNRSVMFHGKVKIVGASFPADGRIEAQILCYSYGWKAAKNVRTYVYPSSNCKRDFAKGKESIKTSEIIKGIFAQTFSGASLDMSIKKDVVYTRIKPYVQSGITDWAAFRQLAKNADCVLYETATESGSIIHITDEKELHKPSSEPTGISFRYASRGDQLKSNVFIQDHLDDVNQIEVESASISIDQDITGQSIRLVTDFGNGADNSKMFAVQYNDNTQEAVLYELRSDVVKALPVALQDDLWSRLTYDAEDVTWDEIKDYFQVVKPEDRIVPGYEDNLGDMDFADSIAWLGWHFNARWIGDVQVQPYRAYPVYGIGKFSTAPGGKKGRIYLESLASVLS